MTSGRAWSLISLGTDRQYQGNVGYEDVLKQSYQYDSSVQNHKQLSAGDLVFLRGSKSVLGVALIQKITSKPGTKPQRRCPVCGNTGLKERKTVTPRWRCGNGHAFPTPVEQSISVTVYKADYGDTFIAMPDNVPVSLLKSAALRPSDQLSIEEIDAHKIEAPLLHGVPSSRELFARFVQQWRPDREDADVEPAPGDGMSYNPSQADQRSIVLRSIRARRGQKGFRKKLIDRYGPRCLVSGCSVLDIVEAAHIWPYRGDADNHPANGLLLRADLHTLFDLDLMGINPETLSASFHPDVAGEGYGTLNGRLLGTGLHHKPDHKVLALRWAMYLARTGNG